MLFGTGLAFFLGKPFIQPVAPRLPSINLGFWSNIRQVQAALQINALFFIGVILAPLMLWRSAHALGIDRSNGRREHRCGACDGIFHQRRPRMRR